MKTRIPKPPSFTPRRYADGGDVPSLTVLLGGGGDDGDDGDDFTHPLVVAGADLLDAIARRSPADVASALSAAFDLHASGYAYEEPDEDSDPDED